MFYEKHQVAHHPGLTEPELKHSPSNVETIDFQPRKGRTESESREIQYEAEKLRRRFEEDYHKRLEESKLRVDNHLSQHGGDLSLLIKDGIPVDMRCVQLMQWGSNDDYVKTARVPLPLPMKDEVLIKSYSCGVSFHDLLTRQGTLDSWVRSLRLPFIMGCEVAGEIIGVGRNVTDLKPGDRVIALPERKAWAEYVVCKTEHCFVIPDDMSFNEAVALTVDGIVAYVLLFEMGGLKAGNDPCGLNARRKNILMHSAAGSLTDMVIQMLRSVPNVRLFKIALLEEEILVPDELIHYIDRDADYVMEVRHASPQGIDLVLDCNYENNFNRDFHLLRPMGKYVQFGTHAAFREGHPGFMETAKSVGSAIEYWLVKLQSSASIQWWGTDKISPLKLYEENKTVCGFNLRNLLYYQHDRQYVRDLFCRVCKLWQDGKIEPRMDCILQFEDFSEAFHRMQEHGNQVEKIILNPFMTKEEARHQRNYLVLAEKIVDDRRKKKKAEKESIFHKFHLPGAGELAEEITPEEKAREALEAKRQKEREEIERKLKTEQAKIDATEESMTFPATVILETPLKLPSAGITEPPVPSTKTVASEVASTQTFPSASTTQMATEEIRDYPILKREKVQFSIPMTEEETGEFRKEASSNVLEPRGD